MNVSTEVLARYGHCLARVQPIRQTIVHRVGCVMLAAAPIISLAMLVPIAAAGAWRCMVSIGYASAAIIGV